jgi:hypothetical protein
MSTAAQGLLAAAVPRGELRPPELPVAEQIRLPAGPTPGVPTPRLRYRPLDRASGWTCCPKGVMSNLTPSATRVRGRCFVVGRWQAVRHATFSAL